MGRNDMNHMQHLESVALSDCAVLISKESTYKGSWKRAGGRSAWFMARRNLDRLITMMSPKEFPEYIKTYENVRATVKSLDVSVHYNFDPVKQTVSPLPGSIEATRGILSMLLDSYEAEDIFMKIRANPGGEDGTVLACLRDARRYFTLVEAEMIAEGVVVPETATYELENQPQFPEWDGEAIDELRIELENGQAYVVKDIKSFRLERKHGICSISIERNGVPAPAPHSPGSGGYAMEQRIRHAGLTDSLGKPMVYGDLYQWRRPEDGTVWIVKAVAPQEGQVKVEGEPAVPEDGRLVPGHELTHTERATRLVDPVRELKPGFDKVLSEGKVYEEGRPLRDPTPEEVKELKAQLHDGGAHSREQNPLWPWHATAEEYESLKARAGAVVDLFYTRRAAGVYQLESVVGSSKCPREIASHYEYVTRPSEVALWLIKRDQVPAELENNFPRLPGELNDKEYSESRSDFRFMYWQDESDLKWKLRKNHEAWRAEPN